MTEIVPFNFEGAEVRTVSRDGEPWFALTDIGRVLEHSTPRNLANILDDDEKGAISARTPGGVQSLIFVSESGLYRILMRSDKPQAKPFQKWVTAEVLPSIRRTGGYSANRSELIAHALVAANEIIEEQTARLAVVEPKADALDRLALTDGSMCITDAAKTLQVPPRALFRLLRSKGWIYQRPGTHDIGYQEHIAAGRLEHKTTTVTRTDGTEKTVTQVRVTPKGLVALALMLRQDDDAALAMAKGAPIQ